MNASKVAATLRSARAQSVYVADGATADVVYEFEVDGHLVVLDGRLGIGIRVHESDAGMDEDGGVGCPPGDAGICP